MPRRARTIETSVPPFAKRAWAYVGFMLTVRRAVTVPNCGLPEGAGDGAADAAEIADVDGSADAAADAKPTKTQPDKPNPGVGSNGSINRTPRPGARPKRRKR